MAFNRVRTIGDVEQIRMLAHLIAVVAQSRGAKVTANQFLPWQPEDDKTEQDPEQTLRSMPGGGSAIQQVLDELAELEQWNRENPSEDPDEHKNGNRGKS